jgi:hypothetical protein
MSRVGYLRAVVSSVKLPGTHGPYKTCIVQDTLECGHICTVRDDGMTRRRCEACALGPVNWWPTGKK